MPHPATRVTFSWFLAAIMAVATATIGWASEMITPENARVLREFTRFEPGIDQAELAFLANGLLCAYGSDRAALVDPRAGEIVDSLDTVGAGRVLGVSPSRDLLALYTVSRHVAVWSAEPLEPQQELGQLTDVSSPSAVISPDRRRLAVETRWNEIDLWDLAEGILLHRLSAHRSNLFDLAFSPDGRLLASGGG